MGGGTLRRHPALRNAFGTTRRKRFCAPPRDFARGPPGFAEQARSLRRARHSEPLPYDAPKTFLRAPTRLRAWAPGLRRASPLAAPRPALRAGAKQAHAWRRAPFPRAAPRRSAHSDTSRTSRAPPSGPPCTEIHASSLHRPSATRPSRVPVIPSWGGRARRLRSGAFVTSAGRAPERGTSRGSRCRARTPQLGDHRRPRYDFGRR